MDYGTVPGAGVVFLTSHRRLHDTTTPRMVAELRYSTDTSISTVGGEAVSRVTPHKSHPSHYVRYPLVKLLTALS